MPCWGESSCPLRVDKVTPSVLLRFPVGVSQLGRTIACCLFGGRFISPRLCGRVLYRPGLCRRQVHPAPCAVHGERWPSSPPSQNGASWLSRTQAPARCPALLKWKQNPGGRPVLQPRSVGVSLLGQPRVAPAGGRSHRPCRRPGPPGWQLPVRAEPWPWFWPAHVLRNVLSPVLRLAPEATIVSFSRGSHTASCYPRPRPHPQPLAFLIQRELTGSLLPAAPGHLATVLSTMGRVDSWPAVMPHPTPYNVAQ